MTAGAFSISTLTAHPTAEWTGLRLREAFPFDRLPRYLLRDRDAMFGDAFREQVGDMGIQEVLGTPRSPWQRAHVERLVGSIRRECLDHVLVFQETSLRRVLRSYFDYYPDRERHLYLREGLARAAIHPAGASRESRGASAGRRAASPLRTTGRLSHRHPLWAWNQRCGPLRPENLTRCVLAARQSKSETLVRHGNLRSSVDAACALATAYVERVIVSIRRECLGHVIVFHESSLRRTPQSYFEYYHRSRMHLSLGKDALKPRAIQPPEMGTVVAVSQVGGPHHRYERRDA
jgi:transposase InsO family protein